MRYLLILLIFPFFRCQAQKDIENNNEEKWKNELSERQYYILREIRGTDMPEIYLCLLVSQSLRSGNRMNIAAEIISINVIGRSQINWIPFALRIARPRLSSNI